VCGVCFWRCALLISSPRSLDMLMLVRTSASHHPPTTGISQKKQKRKFVAEKRVVSMEQRRCSRKTLKKNVEEALDAGRSK